VQRERLAASLDLVPPPTPRALRAPRAPAGWRAARAMAPTDPVDEWLQLTLRAPRPWSAALRAPRPPPRARWAPRLPRPPPRRHSSTTRRACRSSRRRPLRPRAELIPRRARPRPPSGRTAPFSARCARAPARRAAPRPPPSERLTLRLWPQVCPDLAGLLAASGNGSNGPDVAPSRRVRLGDLHPVLAHIRLPAAQGALARACARPAQAPRRPPAAADRARHARRSARRLCLQRRPPADPA